MDNSVLKRRLMQWLSVLCVLFVGAGSARGQAGATTDPQGKETQESTAKDATETERLDPQAVAELKKMTAFLDRNAHVTLKVRSVWEAIQESGMKLQFQADQEIRINRPNQIYTVSRRNDGTTTRLWYDRNTLTHLNVEDNTYAQLTVPETINEMLDHVLEHYAIPTPPMLDFLYGDAATSFMSEITDAVYVGECVQAGRKCHHLAFSQPDLDYQIWIPTEGDPLPVKYSITWTDEPLLPWFTAYFLEWNTKPTFPDGFFAASVPKGAKRVEVARSDDRKP